MVSLPLARGSAPIVSAPGGAICKRRGLCRHGDGRRRRTRAPAALLEQNDPVGRAVVGVAGAPDAPLDGSAIVALFGQPGARGGGVVAVQIHRGLLVCRCVYTLSPEGTVDSRAGGPSIR